jgi:ATP-binding cassette subfamily C protein
MSDRRDLGRQCRRLLLGELGRRRGSLWRLAAWSLPEALPALLSGQLIARALDHGFLSHRPLVGLGYLAALGVACAIAALAVSRSYAAVAGIIEPLRDTLVRRVAGGTLRRAAAGEGKPDQAAVARLTQQVETVRDAAAGLVLVLRRVAVTLAAAIAGLGTLAPVLFLFVTPPLVLSLVAF